MDRLISIVIEVVTVSRRKSANAARKKLSTVNTALARIIMNAIRAK